MLITDVLAYLLAQPAITDLVADRIQSIPAPVGTDQYPCITYQGASDVEEDANEGPAGVVEARIIFDCRAYDRQVSAYLPARTIAETLAGILRNFSGTLPGGTEVRRIEVNIVDGWDDGSKVSSSKVHAMFTYYR